MGVRRLADWLWPRRPALRHFKHVCVDQIEVETVLGGCQAFLPLEDTATDAHMTLYTEHLRPRIKARE